MFAILFLETIRSGKALLKNYTAVIIGLIFTCMICLSFFENHINFLSGFLSSNILYLACLIVLVEFFLILHQKKPIVIIKPALFHLAFNSPNFKKVKCYMVMKKLLLNVIFMVLIYLFLFGCTINLQSLKTTLLIISYLLICTLIKWFKYNQFNIIITSILYLSTSVFFLYSITCNNVIILSMYLLLCLTSLFFANKVTVNWGKYFDDIVYAEKIDAAGRHLNIAEITQITNETMAKGNTIIKIYTLPMNKKNAIVCKAIIEFLRTGKKLFIIWAILLIIALALVKIPINLTNSFINTSHLFPMISSVMISGFFVNIIKQCNTQFQSVVDKHKRGFFIPFDYKRIMLSYLFVCIFIVAGLALLIFSILTSTVIKFLACFFSVIFVTFIIFILMENKSVQRLNNYIFVAMNAFLAFIIFCSI